METMHGGCATIVPRHALHNNIIKRVPGRCLGGGVHIFVSQFWRAYGLSVSQSWRAPVTAPSPPWHHRERERDRHDSVTASAGAGCGVQGGVGACGSHQVLRVLGASYGGWLPAVLGCLFLGSGSSGSRGPRRSAWLVLFSAVLGDMAAPHYGEPVPPHRRLRS